MLKATHFRNVLKAAHARLYEHRFGRAGHTNAGEVARKLVDVKPLPTEEGAPFKVGRIQNYVPGPLPEVLRTAADAAKIAKFSGMPCH